MSRCENTAGSPPQYSLWECQQSCQLLKKPWSDILSGVCHTAKPWELAALRQWHFLHATDTKNLQKKNTNISIWESDAINVDRDVKSIKTWSLSLISRINTLYPNSACVTTPHLNAPGIAMLLWVCLSGESPAAMFMSRSYCPGSSCLFMSENGLSL